MLTKTAIGFGFVMFIVGLLGLVPGVVDLNGNLFGTFQVNTAHNAIHVVTGLAAIACGSHSFKAARIYFLTLGIVYGMFAILGFIPPNNMVVGAIANNDADAWLNSAIAVGALALGLAPARWFTHEAVSIPHRPPPPLAH